MWFMYEYTENEITELNQSYDTRLSEEEKKKDIYTYLRLHEEISGIMAYGTETGIQKLFSYRMQRQK